MEVLLLEQVGIVLAKESAPVSAAVLIDPLKTRVLSTFGPKMASRLAF